MKLKLRVRCASPLLRSVRRYAPRNNKLKLRSLRSLRFNLLLYIGFLYIVKKYITFSDNIYRGYGVSHFLSYFFTIKFLLIENEIEIVAITKIHTFCEEKIVVKYLTIYKIHGIINLEKER